MSGEAGGIVYFAYGANLHPGWLRRRVTKLGVIGRAELPGHRIAFRKRGRDGSAKSDVCPTGDPADRLPGALYRLPAGDMGRLGAAEAGYHATEVVVESGDGPMAALTWRADAQRLTDSLLPWDWYVALIRAGADYHALPAAYREWLASVPVRPDPEHARADIALAVLRAGPDEAR